MTAEVHLAAAKTEIFSMCSGLLFTNKSKYKSQKMIIFENSGQNGDL